MGNFYDKYYAKPDTMPTALSPPSFDPNVGFQNGRKPRVMLATKEEMDSARVPPEKRDYCAHMLLRLYSCKSLNWPWMVKCHHEKEEYAHCQFEDYVLRMKEYERERRLLERQKRIQARSG